MEKNIENSSCGCPKSKSLKPTKYYQEIGAEVIGNQLLIRVEKDKNKLKKKSSEWVPPCDCESIPEIKLPTRKQGVRIVNIDKNNQIIFRIDSKSRLKCEDPDYQPEIMSYQLGDSSHNDQQRTLMVYPQLEGSGSQKIHRNHLKIGNQNIFTMNIKKKPDAKERKSRNIELEVTYPNLPPRIPTPPPPPPPPPVIDTPAIDVPEVLDVQLKKVAEEDEKKKKGKKKKKKLEKRKKKKNMKNE